MNPSNVPLILIGLAFCAISLIAFRVRKQLAAWYTGFYSRASDPLEANRASEAGLDSLSRRWLERAQGHVDEQALRRQITSLAVLIFAASVAFLFLVTLLSASRNDPRMLAAARASYAEAAERA